MKDKKTTNPIIALFDSLFPELNKAIYYLGNLPKFPTLKKKKEESNHTSS